jgi:hypothetical protein
MALVEVLYGTAKLSEERRFGLISAKHTSYKSHIEERIL